MVATGYAKRFPCAQGEQYELIGEFWMQMRAALPDVALCGVGYGWENDSLCYLIGTLDGSVPPGLAIPDADFLSLALPEEGWETWRCSLENLGSTYGEIYAVSRLDWEIEWIDEQCTLMVHRVTG